MTVYYSLSPDADGTRERQWAVSVHSLRQHNQSVRVVLCLYGPPPDSLLATARAAGVEVQPMGSYADALGDIPPHWRAALVTNPTLHKLLSLRSLAAGEPLIYLDCDTYVFGDIAVLPDRYAGSGFCAREEQLPGADLSGVCRAEGLIPVRAYNTGVMLLDAALVRVLVSLLDDFVWYTWRLLLGACLYRPELVDDRSLADCVLSASESERRLALPYPAPCLWIIEEVATWLTLGRVPGLPHDLLRREDVAQDGECTVTSGVTSGVVLAHYFTNHADRFFGGT